MENLKESIRNVDRRYGIYPLIEDRMLLDGKAEEFVKKGFGGVVGNLEYDGAFPYNEEAWTKVKENFQKFISHGMEGIIYDEYGYPSGTARGTVLDNHPEYAAKGAFCYLHFKPLAGRNFHKVDIPDGEFLGAFLVDDKTGVPIDISEERTKSGGLQFFIEAQGRFYLILMVVRTLFEGTHCTANYCEVRKYISMSDADATKEFLRITHDNYYRILGEEFGKGVKAFFTDEPSLIAYTNQPGPMAILPWHEKYPLEFMDTYGYDIRRAMCAVLFKRGNDCAKRKCDYWEYITKTVAEGYFQTIADWCKKHGVAMAGHCLSEENIQWHIVNYGSLYEIMKRFDWPGIDMLGTIEEHLMDECFPFAKLAASVADVYKSGVALSEFSDIKSTYSGSNIGLQDIYRSVHWHIALGINKFVSLYSFKGISDKEIYDLNDYVARLNKLMSSGRRECDIAVLYPEFSAWANYTSNGYHYATDPTDGINQLSKTLNKTAWELLHGQVDFNFIDNSAIDDCEVKQGQIIVNGRNYRTLILPYCEVLREKTAWKVLDIANAGVDVIFVGKAPYLSRETGIYEEVFVHIKHAVDKGKIVFVPYENISSIGTRCQARTFLLHKGEQTRFERILTHRRKIDENTYLMMVSNIGNQTFIGDIDFGELYQVTRFDIKDGHAKDLGEKRSIEVSLGNGEACVFGFVNKGVKK